MSEPTKRLEKLRARKARREGRTPTGHRKKANQMQEIIVEGDDVRVFVADVRWEGITIQQMPGKPLKRKVKRSTVDLSNLRNTLGRSKAADHFLLANVKRQMKLSSGMSYEKALNELGKVIKASAEDALNVATDIQRPFLQEMVKKPENQIETEAISYLKVAPKNYKPITFSGKGFSGISKWDKFTFSSDGSDNPNEGTAAFNSSSSEGAARKLFKILKANPTLTDNMTEAQFEQMLAKAKIKHKYNPSVWR